MTTQLMADIRGVAHFGVSDDNPSMCAGEEGYTPSKCRYDSASTDMLEPEHETNNGCYEAGMDFERCATLHNVIVRHGWSARGHNLCDLPERTYWERWDPRLTPYQRKRLEDRLHPSVLDFLKRALDLPDFYPGSFKAPTFFYHLTGLNAPLELFANHEHVEGDRYVTLYGLQAALVASEKVPDGLVYDQLRHQCCMIKAVGGPGSPDLAERDLLWQPLEAALSTYLEMIETDKVVALPKTVKGPDRHEYVKNPAGGYALREIPDEELRDPRTGARRTAHDFDPWVMVPFTEKDIELALDAWQRLLQLIEKSSHQCHHRKRKQAFRGALYSQKVLDRAGLRPNGFAYRFLSEAQRPSFMYLAPGLRSLSAEDFEDQPCKDAAYETGHIKPVLLLRGSENIGTWSYPDVHEEEVPTGLYLDCCDLNSPFPFENATTLVIPCEVPCHGPKPARLRDSDDGLLLSSSPHQLHTILQRFGYLVESGHWQVGPEGVLGGIAELGSVEEQRHQSKHCTGKLGG